LCIALAAVAARVGRTHAEFKANVQNGIRQKRFESKSFETFCVTASVKKYEFATVACISFLSSSANNNTTVKIRINWLNDKKSNQHINLIHSKTAIIINKINKNSLSRDMI